MKAQPIPIVSPGRCADCGQRTLAYAGEPLAAIGPWRCPCGSSRIGKAPTPEPVKPAQVPPPPPKPVVVVREPPPPPAAPKLMLPMGGRQPVRMSAVVKSVCTELHLGLNEILGKSRHVRIVFGRELIVTLGKRLTILSYQQLVTHIVAASLGPDGASCRVINHSTAITAHKRLLKQLGWTLSARLGKEDAGRLGLPDGSVGDLVDRLAFALTAGVAA